MVKKKTVNYPFEYLQNPNPKKTQKEMWEVLDGYTCESYYEDESRKNNIDFVIPFPPLGYKGKIIKGAFFSQAVDIIVELYPKIKNIFFPIANSMWSGYPQSEYADYYFVCYNNLKRQKYWTKHHPEKKNLILLPLQDADWTNEYEIAPTFNTPKETDIICTTTPYAFKNMPMFASAIKAYEAKYNKLLKVNYILGCKDIIKNDDGTIDYSQIRHDVKEQLDKVFEILGDPYKYITFYPWINRCDISKFYTGAKCCVLCSLIEGKNRALQEAQCCDTPIIIFKDHNKFAKGEYPIIYKNSGEYAPNFTSESLADTIHKVLSNYKSYTPRANYLKYNGRKNFINKLIDMSPYYKRNIPGYKKGKIQENLWVDLAMQDNYQLSFIDFLYGKNVAIQHVAGIENIGELIKFFFSRFNIK